MGAGGTRTSVAAAPSCRSSRPWSAKDYLESSTVRLRVLSGVHACSLSAHAASAASCSGTNQSPPLDPGSGLGASPLQFDTRACQLPRRRSVRLLSSYPAPSNQGFVWQSSEPAFQIFLVKLLSDASINDDLVGMVLSKVQLVRVQFKSSALLI